MVIEQQQGEMAAIETTIPAITIPAVVIGGAGGGGRIELNPKQVDTVVVVVVLPLTTIVTMEEWVDLTRLEEATHHHLTTIIITPTNRDRVVEL